VLISGGTIDREQETAFSLLLRVRVECREGPV
jgi:hypothetical protein